MLGAGIERARAKGSRSMKHAIFYLVTLVVCVAVDFIWLKTTSDRLYGAVMGDMLAPQPRLGAAVAFYLLYAAGITIFVGAPALRAGSWSGIALYGPLFALFCYMTYDLTNQATLRNWSIVLTVSDILWGMVLTTVSASAAYFVTRNVAKG
jgi:uncharacterized membrane protein